MKSNASRNRKSPTRWQRCVTGLRISRVLLCLLALGLIKLVLVGSAGFWGPESGPVSAALPVVAGQAQAAEPVETEQPGQEAQVQEPQPPEGVDAADWKILKRKQDELAAKERALMQLQRGIEAKLAELEVLEKRIAKMLDQADALKDKKIKQLVDFYSNMKAKQAAAVLETMDEDLAVKILSGMRGRQAGEILTFVETKKAAKLSEDLTKLQIPLGE
ncbi:MAG: hypothetical protein JW718_01540 [Desulfovibrionaceae bacterium]|nr:hypothetical protein [Desulfovibrionaceae bacterium]